MSNLNAPVYHYTDTIRLPWILRSGSLEPGKNAVGGFPDPDFLWASGLPYPDPTASAHRGQHFRSGRVSLVRFILPRNEFFRWADVRRTYPTWTRDQVRRLETFAKQVKALPGSWWCRAEPLPIASAEIETLSSGDKEWQPLTNLDVIDGGNGLLILPGKRWGSLKLKTMFDGRQAYAPVDLSDAEPEKLAAWGLMPAPRLVA